MSGNERSFNEMEFWPSNFDSLNTDEKLIFGAYRSLLEKGYRGTTSRTIASMAGVNQGLIHHYFGSQEALFARMIYRMHQKAHRVVESAATRREALMALCEMGAATGSLEADLCGMARDMPLVKQALQDTMACREQDVMEVFGFDRKEDVTIFTGALRGMQIEMRLNPDLDRDACLNRLARWMLGGPQALDEPLKWCNSRACLAGAQEGGSRDAENREVQTGPT